MALRVKFPIRAKLMLLMGCLVLAATTSYLLLASKIFKDDKTELVYELNASSVKTLAAEVDAYLAKFVDKMKLLTQVHRNNEWSKALFESEPDLVAFDLYEPSDPIGTWTRTASVRSVAYLKLYGLKTQELEKIKGLIPIPFQKILSKGTAVWNSTIKDGAPLLSLAIRVNIKNSPTTLIAVADVRLDKLLRLIPNRGIATIYVINDEGRVIAHPDEKLLTEHSLLGDLEIVREAVDSPVGFQMKPFSINGTKWLGAYSAVGFAGLSVISQIEEKQAYRASARLIQKSLIFAALVITAAFLLSNWLARGVTNPLSHLVAATEKIAKWEFNKEIPIKGNDEVAVLAQSFNKMASELHKQHIEIQAHQAHLEQKVRERTAALEDEKRRASEAQDALLRTTRLASLGELAGIAAHEILNPVNNINIRIERNRVDDNKNGTSDLSLMSDIISGWKKAYQSGGWENLKQELSRTTEDNKSLLEEDLENLEAIIGDEKNRHESRAEDIQFFETEIGRITRLVNSMRALSRVKGEKKPIDVHLPIQDTLVTLSDLMKKKNVCPITSFAGDGKEPLIILADKDELVQVFSNLIRNGLQAINSAGQMQGKIHISTRKQSNRVEVLLSDNGCGISAENLKKIFEPHFTTKSVEEGTGLGLSISRRLVRAFGGDISLEKTEEGKGTTFLVWFPSSME